MATAPLYLVVTRGRSMVVRLVLGGEPRTIGRSRDADLILRDTLVSRRHALASVAEGVARLAVCEGGRPVLVNGESLREATLNPGDAIVIGDTPLLLCRDADAGSEVPADLSRTDIRTLMTGVAADVRGLATVMHLVEALDAAADAAAVEEALRDWSREALPATDAVLTPGDAEPELSSD